MAFLYRGDEPGSTRLRLALDQLALAYGARLWSDERATDPGFAAELTQELGQADAIVHSVGEKGLGRYQGLNEIGATIDALRARPNQRLVVVVLGNAPKPPEFSLFAEFAGRTATLELDPDDPNAVRVLREALPGAMPRSDTEEGRFAAGIVQKTLGATVQKSLT